MAKQHAELLYTCRHRQPGEEVANLANAEWADKVKAAISLDDAKLKSAYDELRTIRRQIRNYMAYSAFGKRSEAFDFHSSACAVPVNLTDGPNDENTYRQ